jgi:hypothetical protein
MVTITQPFSLVAAAVATVVVDGTATGTIVVAPASATGSVARATAFGVANGGNFDGGVTMTQPSWQAAVKAVGGFYCWRFVPDTNANYTDGNSTTPPAQGSASVALDNVLNGLISIGLTNVSVIICMGGPSSGGVVDANYGNLVAQCAQYTSLKFHNAGWPANPCTLWEGRNESGDNSTSGPLMRAALNALGNDNWGAPYSGHYVLGPVESNAPDNQSGLMPAFVSAMSGKNNVGISFHYYAGTNFGVTSGGGATSTNQQIALAIDSNHGYGAEVNHARATATASANWPVAITEYNMNGINTPFEESEDYNGAVFAALATSDAIKNGNINYMTIWDAYQNDATNDVYGIINGSNSRATAHVWVSPSVNSGGAAVPAFAIFPVAWVLGRMANYVPGNVVTTTTTGLNNVYTMATVDASGNFKSLVITNYGTSNAILAIKIGTTNPTSLGYFSVDSTHPAQPYGPTTGPLIGRITTTDMAGFTVYSRSVVILTP